ncbi:MAG TPA: hypothetical protein VGK74_01550 [Symbiobacteriaceae bacterium]|jgi:hypothetical protein
MGLSWAVVAGILGGVGVILLAKPIPAFSFNQVSVISWRGNGDNVPGGVESSGWSAPMFYTTPDEGADPGPPAGRFPTGVWAPGDTVERSLNVRNRDPGYMMSLEKIEVELSGNRELAALMTLTVSQSGGPVLWQGRLSDVDDKEVAFYQPVRLRLNDQQALSFAVSLDRSAGQSLQGKSVKADFTIEASRYTLPMIIDVHPGSWPNPINPGAKGDIPVAINGSATFDVHNLDWTTARFGPNQVEPLRKAAFSDWNHDSYTDMILHFDTSASGFTCGMTMATLTIAAYSGEVYQGSDPIVTPPCR